jgi:hypothetical protein
LTGQALDLTNLFEVDQEFKVDVYINFHDENEFFMGAQKGNRRFKAKQLSETPVWSVNSLKYS